jgi:5,10-methenyltetrahydromethanopterin hydrogenase
MENLILAEKMITKLVRASLSLLNPRIMPRKQRKTQQTKKLPKPPKADACVESSEDIDYCEAE